MRKNITGRSFAYLLRQIWNERRSNWALLAELLIVCGVVWYLVDSACVMMYKAAESPGFNADNCYRLTLTEIRKGEEGYDWDVPEGNEQLAESKLELLGRLKRDNEIECAAYSVMSDPYQYYSTSSGAQFDTVQVQVVIKECQPDMALVFRYESVDGKTPQQLADLLREDKLLVSEGMFGDDCDMTGFYGKTIDFYFNDDHGKRVGAVIKPVKRFNSDDRADCKTVVAPLSDGALGNYPVSLAIRVKAGCEDGFAERFRQKIEGGGLRSGNVKVTGIESYDDIKARTDKEGERQMQIYMLGLAFLLFNVFIGLLGSFWFRTQCRFPDIGLQKAMGATGSDIALRLLAEAALLLTAAFIPSLAIDYNIGNLNLTLPYQEQCMTLPRLAATAAVTYLLMLVIIAVGVWMPARRAAKANPVEVLRGE